MIEGWKGRNGPEPDIAIIYNDYAIPGPSAMDTYAVFEVSDTTLKRDRQKTRLYLRAGIPSCYVVNIPGTVVEEYLSIDNLDNPGCYILGMSFNVLGVTILVDDLFKGVKF
jgi:hypothetical protein